MAASHRLKLLSDSEIEAIYALPAFTPVEQSLYFTFTDREIKRAKQYRTVKAQVCFMLSLGYFKAKQQFYLFDLASSQDAQYIVSTYFGKNYFHLSGKLDHKTYRKQKNDILTLFSYQNWSPEFEPQIELQLGEFLRYYPKVHNALRQLLGSVANSQLGCKELEIAFLWTQLGR